MQPKHTELGSDPPTTVRASKVGHERSCAGSGGVWIGEVRHGKDCID